MHKRGSRNPTSMLIDETWAMDRQRREIEQSGHRQWAKVNQREHSEPLNNAAALEGELQNSIQPHAFLETQRFDGTDNNVNPVPALNTEARREFDNEQREQALKKQLQLGNMPQFSTAPVPRGL